MDADGRHVAISIADIAIIALLRPCFEAADDGAVLCSFTPETRL